MAIELSSMVNELSCGVVSESQLFTAVNASSENTSGKRKALRCLSAARLPPRRDGSQPTTDDNSVDRRIGLIDTSADTMTDGRIWHLREWIGIPSIMVAPGQWSGKYQCQGTSLLSLLPWKSRKE